MPDGIQWHPLDVILIAIALEWIALSVHYLRTRRGIGPLDLLANLLSGFFIFLALRLSLTGAGPAWIGLALFLSFLMHLADLRRRWRH